MEDFLAIGLLVFMEGALSIDNALVLAVMTRSLPEGERRKALTYGIWGAIGFRILALCFLSFLLKWAWIKWVGGGYLLYLAYKHFFGSPEVVTSHEPVSGRLWKVILAVELTDIAFSADSILASIAVSSKIWVIATGGVLGIIAMRFSAQIFTVLLDKFPKFETTAYLLVGWVGLKLVFEGFGLHFSPILFWAVSLGMILLALRKDPVLEKVQ